MHDNVIAKQIKYPR